MTERQEHILSLARQYPDNELVQAIIDHAETIAEETLATELYINGVRIR